MVAKVVETFKACTINHHQAIRLIRHIGRDDFYNQSTEYENDDDVYIFEIFQTNNTKFYVNLGQISNIIGEEEWFH